MYFCNFVIISQCKKVWPFHLNKLKSSLPRDAFCQVWLKLAQWFWRRRFFKIVNVFLLFHNYLPLEKLGPFIKRTWVVSFNDDLWQVWLKLAPWFWKRWFFSNSLMSFFVIISPWKRAEPLIWTNFNPFHQLCAKFGWNWPNLEKKMKMWKVNYNNEDDNNSNGQRTNFDEKSSIESVAHVS